MAWPLDGLNWKQICNAVCKIYRRGHRALGKTIDDPDAENFHAWRKRVKDVWYQLRILQPLNRTVLEEMAQDAEVLGELLGSEHDLDFLRARLERETGDETLAHELAQLQKLIGQTLQRIAPRCAGTRTAFLRGAIQGVCKTHLHLCQQTKVANKERRSPVRRRSFGEQPAFFVKR